MIAHVMLGGTPWSEVYQHKERRVEHLWEDHTELVKRHDELLESFLELQEGHRETLRTLKAKDVLVAKLAGLVSGGLSVIGGVPRGDDHNPGCKCGHVHQPGEKC